MEEQRMTGLGERIVQARNASTSIGPVVRLLPSPLLGAAFMAVAMTENVPSPASKLPEVDESAKEAQAVLAAVAELPPEAHMPRSVAIDVPAPPPLENLRQVEEELAAEAAKIDEEPVRPVRRAHVAKNVRTAKIQVKKMSEPIVRLKNGNGTHRNGNGHAAVVAVPAAKKPTLDAPEVALVWLDGLARKVNAATIPLLLEHYRRLGWIPADAYGMLVELATGLNKSAQPATWRMVKNDARSLAKIHLESYKKLKALFGTRMTQSF